MIHAESEPLLHISDTPLNTHVSPMEDYLGTVNFNNGISGRGSEPELSEKINTTIDNYSIFSPVQLHIQSGQQNIDSSRMNSTTSGETTTLLSGSPGMSWQKCFGGSDADYGRSIQQTDDGGYIIAGSSTSNDGNVTGNHGAGSIDYWIVKITSLGELSWQKCFGGSYYDYAQSIQQTDDGGYIVAGFTNSNDGNVTNNHGEFDY